MIDDILSAAFATVAGALGRPATLHLSDTVSGPVGNILIGAPAPALGAVATVEATISQGTVQVPHSVVSALLTLATRTELGRGDVFEISSGPQAGSWRVSAARQIDGGVWLCAVTHAPPSAIGTARRLS